MSRVFDVMFNDGQDESADKIALPDGKFRLLQNCRLTRDGRIEPRQNYVSLTNVTGKAAGGTMRAFDVCSYQDRLMAVGSADGGGYTPGYGRNLYSYVNNAESVWQLNPGFNIPPMASCKRLWQAPNGLTADSFDVAYTNGQVCVVQADSSQTQITATRIDVATNTVLSHDTYRTAFVSTIVSARVIAVGNLFVMCQRLTNGDIVGYTLDTSSTAVTWTGPTSISAAEATGSFQWDLAPLGGTSDFLIAYPRVAAGSMRLRRLTTAFAVVNTLDLAGPIRHPCVIGDTTHGVLYTLTNTGTGDVALRTATTALAVTVGPTFVLGSTAGFTAATTQAGMAFVSATQVTVMAGAAGSLGDENTQFAIRNIATHANNGTDEYPNKTTTSKPVALDFATGPTSECYAIGTLPVGGNEGSALRFYAAALIGVDQSNQLVAGEWDYGIASTMSTTAVGNTSGRSSIVTDGAGRYWCVVGQVTGLNVGAQVAGTAQLFEMRLAVADRHQIVEANNALYVSGGITYVFDGTLGASESGFLDVPVIDATITASAAGSLTLLGTYKYIAMFEWIDGNGYTHRSTQSDTITTTLTGGNNALTLTVSVPKSMRCNKFLDSKPKIVLYRNTPGDSVFYRVAERAVTDAALGALALLDTRSDTDAQTREVIYTQSQKPVSNVSPQPNRFVAVGRDRAIYGGLPDPYQVAFSQAVFPGEPIESASPNSFAFTARLPERVTGLEAFGDTYIVFTEDAIYQVPGSGPQRNGVGEFFYPQCLYSDAGCIDWRSIVTCGAGTFFQAAADKLFLLTGGSASFVGQPIRDTLALFPTICGSVLCSETHRVVFACSNLADTDGVLLVYDLRRQTWSVDTVGQALRSVAEYLGRLAYVGKDGLVYLENAVGTYSGALPSVSIRTGSFKLFPANGNGDLIKVTLSGTYTGDSTVDGFISYDDGKNWISMGQQAATTANLFNMSPASGAAVVSGDAVQVVFTPNLRNVTRFALRFDITNGTDNGGLWAHMISLEVDAQEFTTRQPARNQR